MDLADQLHSTQSKQGGNPKHVFCVFNTDNVQAHVAEIGELIEFWAQPTTAMTNYYGKEEIGIWWQNEDGTYSISPDWNGANYLQNHYLELGPNNRYFCVLSTEFYETQYTDPIWQLRIAADGRTRICTRTIYLHGIRLFTAQLWKKTNSMTWGISSGHFCTPSHHNHPLAND